MWDLPVPESPIRQSGWLFLIHSQEARVWMVAGSMLGLASKSKVRTDFSLGKPAALIGNCCGQSGRRAGVVDLQPGPRLVGLGTEGRKQGEHGPASAFSDPPALPRTLPVVHSNPHHSAQVPPFRPLTFRSGSPVRLRHASGIGWAHPMRPT